MTDQLQNPQDDPGLQKRLLLVFALTFVIILATQPLLRKFAPQLVEPPKQEQQQNQPAAGGGQPAAGPSASQSSSPTQGSAASRGPQAASPQVKQAAAESEVVIENDLYRIVFSNRGAQAKSWILKQYTGDHRKPLDLVNHAAAEKYGYPLSLYAYDEALRNQLNSALYVPSITGTLRAPAAVTFEFSDGEITVRKTFRFDHSYEVRVETEVKRGGSYVTAYPAWPAGFGDQTAPPSYAASSIVVHGPDKVRHEPLYQRNILSSNKWVANGATEGGPFYWAGAVDQYFGAIFLPDRPEQASLVTFHQEIAIPEDLDKPDPAKTVKVGVVGAAVGVLGQPNSLRLYVGPKATDPLRATRAMVNGKPEGPNLEGTVDLGIFGFIAKPFFLWLKWTHDHWVRNWGWAIIILTVIINVVMFPVRLNMMKTSLKMQRIQPQVEAVKKKYEKYGRRDQEKMQQMNQELWDLQRREGGNPLTGCFPMLLQLPFFYAFYAMLSNAIELRHADWLWIHDLAAPDPWHLIPLLCVGVMWLSSHMSPQVGMDPAQRMMMNLMMPIMFGFFTWAAASGLALYWTVGTIIGVVQQWFINRSALGRELHEMQLKRARKAQTRK